MTPTLCQTPISCLRGPSLSPQTQPREPVATAPAPPPLLRRNLLAALAALALAGPARAAENGAVTASLGRYVKRKKLDAIDSYVAPLLAAQDQLVRIGRVMGESLLHQHT